MEIKGDTPAEVKFTYKLLFHFEQKGRIRKAIEGLTGKQNRYTKSEIADYLGSNTEHSKRYADDYLKKLEKTGVLIHAGKRKNADSPDDTWKIDRQKLLDAFTDTEYYKENKKLFAKALDYSREGLDLT
ncbi:hypothetical protein [Natrinema altunense]|uniref:Uncharacterized protein n=1 Tax=Natrinema altunense (strain JCM 12890 / CGMCC 1.3731 / AJ2) TaxID=1227494 RepID=L9ZCF0_NATA2|nr:hypothetical protein [Natrinema altunense]ELY83681.1 hypothetical protein C485_18052 [Natrinema altunense JCM 12890]